MRIIYGITKSNFGGAQRYVFELAKEAQKRGDEVSVICGGQGLLSQKLEKQGIQIHFLPDLDRDVSFVKDIKSFFLILKILKKERPDAFHTNSSKMGILGNLAGRLTRIKKIIFTGHGWAFNENRFWLSKIIILKLTWFTVAFSHKTICVSEKTKKDISWMPFIKNKLVVISNGVENFELKPRSEKGFIVGTLAELHKIKGLDILIKAFKKLRDKHEVKLIILGEGEERKNLEKLVKDLELNDSVELRGYVDNARSELKNFDAYVLSSRSEAMPYSLLEAGFAELPVIATNVGGVPEIIENNISGILIQKENVGELSEALEKIYSDEYLRNTLAQTLKQTIIKKYSIQNTLDQTFKIYK